MVKERRSAKRIKYDMVRVYSKMETHVDGKSKKCFQKKALCSRKIRIKNRSVGIWKSGRPVSLCKKIEMQYQICYTEQWYKRKYNKKRNANESE